MQLVLLLFSMFALRPCVFGALSTLCLFSLLHVYPGAIYVLCFYMQAIPSFSPVVPYFYMAFIVFLHNRISFHYNAYYLHLSLIVHTSIVFIFSLSLSPDTVTLI